MPAIIVCQAIPINPIMVAQITTLKYNSKSSATPKRKSNINNHQDQDHAVLHLVRSKLQALASLLYSRVMTISLIFFNTFQPISSKYSSIVLNFFARI